MDPNATMGLLIDAIAASDWESAEEHATNLLNWLNRGGFDADVKQRDLVSCISVMALLLRVYDRGFTY